MTTKTALAGLNIYSIIAVLIAASLFFHFTSKEETIMAMIAAVAIVYIVMG